MTLCISLNGMPTNSQKDLTLKYFSQKLLSIFFSLHFISKRYQRIFWNQVGQKSIGFCIPKLETSQPILPYSSGQNSLTERPQILGRALCCCCRITVSRESCRLGDVLTNKPCYAEAVLRLGWGWAEAEVDLFTLNKVRPDICICPITIHIFLATYVDMLHWFSSHQQLQLHTCLSTNNPTCI